MANELDELDNSLINEDGQDVHVINKRLLVKVGVGSTIFQIILWVLGIIPGLIFLIMKVKAKSYLQQLQQKLQHDASTIDNYQEQRVIILQNAAKLVDKAIDLDKTTFIDIAKARSGIKSTDVDETRNELQTILDKASRRIDVTLENYPDLKSHQEISDALKQNMYLQQEITAAREVYNDTVMKWNQDIFSWPTKMIVASKMGYTTRIPFIASKQTKDLSKSVFF